MENESSIKEIIRNALEEVRTVMDADTIIGQPVKLDNGTTIIPISKVSMGFASGGLDLPGKTEHGGKKNFGGGGGTGVSVSPIGFLTAFADGHVELLPLKPEQTTTIEQVADIINRAPDILGKIKDVFDKRPGAANKKPTDQPAEDDEATGTEAAKAPVPVTKTAGDNLTDKVLTSMALDENAAMAGGKPAETPEQPEMPEEKRPTREERIAMKAARKKEAADLKKAKKEAARRRASFDYADED